MQRRSSFTLIEIMIVIAILALLVSVSVPVMISAKKTANDSSTKVRLKAMQTALENYASDFGGRFTPGGEVSDFDYLVTEGYLRSSACGGNITSGHSFDCIANETWYDVLATPAGSLGRKTFLLTPVGINEL